MVDEAMHFLREFSDENLQPQFANSKEA
jgi:hypothetical protein